MKANYIVALICIVVVSLVGLMPYQVSANDNETLLIKIHTTSLALKPIGQIQSMGTLKINQQKIVGKKTLWGSDLIEALDQNNADISLTNIGQVKLKQAGIVRLAASFNENNDGTSNHVMVARLISGAMSVDLEERSEAYIEAGGNTFIAESGSVFDVKLIEGEAIVTTFSGNVQPQGNAQIKPDFSKFRIRPVGLGADIDVRARSTREIQVQVTDENDKPVPDVPIIFALAGSSKLGLLGGSKIITDTQGIAKVSFTGGSAGNGSVTATIEGTNNFAPINITVQKIPLLSPTPEKVALVAGGVVTAGIVTGMMIVKDDNDGSILGVGTQIK